MANAKKRRATRTASLAEVREVAQERSAELSAAQATVTPATGHMDANTKLDLILSRLGDIDGRVTGFTDLLATVKQQVMSLVEAERVERVKEIGELKGQVEALTRNQRAQNLVLRGLPESDTQSPLQQARALLESVLPGFQASSLDTAMRLGKRGASTSRLLLLRFATRSARAEALQASRALRAQSIYFDTDLTPNQQAIRREMKPTWDALKAEPASLLEGRGPQVLRGRPGQDSSVPSPAISKLLSTATQPCASLSSLSAP
ncbi:hypothetical protein WJX73_007436 [Symbiochloris irregularis]|uniref:Uncharacterized protein n=1 Tax=Symbiochloris irregularis TaxID=706552 RepID=A0AAW1NVM2_9CHLO